MEELRKPSCLIQMNSGKSVSSKSLYSRSNESAYSRKRRSSGGGRHCLPLDVGDNAIASHNLQRQDKSSHNVSAAQSARFKSQSGSENSSKRSNPNVQSISSREISGNNNPMEERKLSKSLRQKSASGSFESLMHKGLSPDVKHEEEKEFECEVSCIKEGSAENRNRFRQNSSSEASSFIPSQQSAMPSSNDLAFSNPLLDASYLSNHGGSGGSSLFKLD